MDLVSIRMITDDLDRLIEFYEQVTGVEALRHTPVFAELFMPSVTLAIGHTQTIQLFGTTRLAPRTTTPSSSSSASTTLTASTRDSSRWSTTGCRSPPPCHGETAPTFSATPTATSSTSSRRSPPTRSRSSTAYWGRGARPLRGRPVTASGSPASAHARGGRAAGYYHGAAAQRPGVSPEALNMRVPDG